MSTLETTRAEPAPSRPPSNPWSRWPVGYIIAGIVLVLLALGLFVALARSDSDGGGGTVSAPIAGRTEARLDVASGVNVIAVHSGDLGDDLYRISTSDGSGQTPRVSDQDGWLLVGLEANGPNHAQSSVNIELSSAVIWQFRVSGGASEARLDFRGARVNRIDLASGVSSVEMWLPGPAGTLLVREIGGTADLTAHIARAPVRVSVNGGAVIDGASHRGISAGAVFAPDDWSNAADRYDIDAVGGVSQLSVDRL